MIKTVIKRDGTKEPFDAEKMKRAIATAARQANYQADQISGLIEKVSVQVVSVLGDKDEVRSVEIRDQVLKGLDVIAPTVAMSWRNHDQSKV